MLPKFRSTFRKGWKGASVKADIWHGENIDHAQNTDFHWGPLHGEIGLLKIQILLLQISVLKLLASKISIVQKGSTHPFFPPELFDKCFYSIIEIEKCSFGLLKIYLKYLEQIFVILKVWFHHEGGLSESRYFQLFFSTRYEAHPHKKSAFTEPPFLLFLTFGLISSNFVL